MDRFARKWAEARYEKGESNPFVNITHMAGGK